MLSKTIKYIGIFLLAITLTLIFTILTLKWVNPPFTSFTTQADWEQLDRKSYNLRAEWVHYEMIPESMVWAVIASEDQLFFEHSGFDFKSMEKAWEEHQKGVRTRGASTITQQVAKNLFLSPAQSFLRKGVEAVITVCIELLWSKQRIMEVYLNIAEFGPGIFGIGKASNVYFNRSASRITPVMAARFAAVLPNPKQMRVNPPSPYTEERSRWILRQMNQLTGKRFHQVEGTAKDSVFDSTSNDSDSGDKPDTTSSRVELDTLRKSSSD